MKTVIRRLKRLEDGLGATAPRVLRLVVSRLGADASLQKARCKRSACADGTLIEVIDGWGDMFTEEELDRFVEIFPITHARGQA